MVAKIAAYPLLVVRMFFVVKNFRAG